MKRNHLSVMGYQAFDGRRSAKKSPAASATSAKRNARTPKSVHPVDFASQAKA